MDYIFEYIISSKFVLDLLEGDIAIDPSQNDTTANNAIQGNQYLWPGGQVPYTISGQFNSHERAKIAQAMNEYHSKTCIK